MVSIIAYIDENSGIGCPFLKYEESKGQGATEKFYCNCLGDVNWDGCPNVLSDKCKIRTVSSLVNKIEAMKYLTRRGDFNDAIDSVTYAIRAYCEEGKS